MILVILHGIMFLVFFPTKIVVFSITWPIWWHLVNQFPNWNRFIIVLNQISRTLMMLWVCNNYCSFLNLLRSCLYKIYGMKQVYTTSLKDKLLIFNTKMLMSQEMVTCPKQWLFNFVNYKKTSNHSSLIHLGLLQYHFLVSSVEILMGRTVVLYSYTNRPP